MTRDTIFRMFSMSKPVTACAAMILLERGQIDLLDRCRSTCRALRTRCTGTARS